MERTLILLKPDCVQRRLIGRVIARFEDKGLNLIAMKMMRVTPELALHEVLRSGLSILHGRAWSAFGHRFLSTAPVC